MQPTPASQPEVLATILVAPPRNPFQLGRVIARTFSAWWHHLPAFTALTLVADLPILLASVLSSVPVPGVTAPNRNPFDRAAMEAAPTMPQGVWVAYGVTLFLFMVEVGAITHGVIHHLAGKRVSLAAMIGTGFRRFFPLLAVAVICYLMIVVGTVLLVVPGVFLFCAVAVAIPAVVVERPGVFGAIRRSFALTKKNRLAILAAFLVLVPVSFGVTALGGFLLPQLTSSISPMIGTVIGLAVTLVFRTLLWIAPGVVYHDLREAKEGMQTAQLAAVFE
ncbi:MAG TPA: hypothetical protein VIV57_01295 [Anaeromyxobacter sp.]